jgi:hypothetical protein
MWIAVIAVMIIAMGSSAAAPPNGYKCGDGTAEAGKGCRCPNGKVDARDTDGNAICVVAKRDCRVVRFENEAVAKSPTPASLADIDACTAEGQLTKPNAAPA